jgi:hypothetical protein
MATEQAAQAEVVDDEGLTAISNMLAGVDESTSKDAEAKPETEEKVIDSETEEEEVKDDESETSEDAEDEKSEDEEEEEPVAHEKVQRRIDKLTAQKKEALEKAQSVQAEYEQAKTKLAELEEQVNKSSRPVLTPTADSPLADVDTEEALDEKIKSAQEVRRWALRNTDGATVKKPNGEEVYLDADQVKDYLIKSDDLLTLHAPARKQWLAQRQPAVQAAKNLFPDIFKKGTQMHEAFTATVKQAPELLKLPMVEYWVGLALYGEQQLVARQNAEKSKSEAAKKVSQKSGKPPTPASPVSASKSAKGSSKDAARRLMENGDDASLEAFAASLLS